MREASIQYRISTRWIQLVLGLIAMVSISGPQFVWTLFTQDFQDSLHATLPAIQIAFSILILVQTGLSPLQGYIVDKLGARLPISLGCLLSGIGWILSAYATSLTGLYLSYGLFCGIGTGLVYIGIISLVVRWFPHRRGFATGLVAAGYGSGAALTTFPIDLVMRTAGYQHTLIVFGIIFGVVGAAAALAMRMPRAADVRASGPVRSLESGVEPKQMLRSGVFWLMFVMMTMMSTGGLMMISQFSAFSRDFGVADAIVFGQVALPLALTVDRFTNGLTRPFFGWVSDNIGRENTMAIAFLMEAAAVTSMVVFRDNASLFVILSGLVFFGWGEIFTLFPSTLTDTFGSKFATTNYGLLYTAQGIGSVLGGPLAAFLHDQTGSWLPVFAIIIAIDAIAGILALAALKPKRRAYSAMFQQEGANG
jgi:MFS transporter, OFA family, oxalate/formate antiporter